LTHKSQGIKNILYFTDLKLTNGEEMIF